MSKLIVVSNRLPVSLEQDGDGRWRSIPAAGGLVTALMPVLEGCGGTWVGWPGVSTRDNAEVEAHLRSAAPDAGYRCAPVALTRSDVAGFYRGFSNEVLWPLFHDLFARCVFDSKYWKSYSRVNRKFARAALAVSEAGDFIWIQDYHLMTAARELRALGADHRIGFFLHIPFPSPDIYRKIPWRRELLEALIDYDQVGFQTEHDRDNFLDCVADLLPDSDMFVDGRSVRVRAPARSAKDGAPATAKPRETRVADYPISIDFERFAARAASSEVEGQASYLVREAKQRCLFLGIDRLDYSKGLEYKLAAFRKALERYPALRKQVTLMQHVVPSREEVPEYRKLRLEIERTVGEINGQFSAPGWVPVHYFYHTLSPDELSAYYRSADVALVTPLKDGMNLVSKEYCASRVREDGVLILSEFAGAARELGDGAIVVNPFDIEAVADAIHTAYTMEPAAQRARMRALRGTIRARDIHHWVDSYLEAALAASRGDDPPAGPADPGWTARAATGASA